MSADRDRIAEVLAQHGPVVTKPFDVHSGNPPQWMCHGCEAVEPLEDALAYEDRNPWFSRHLADMLVAEGATMPATRFEPTGSAVIDGEYRYELTRSWGTGRHLGIIMLNPSTADANEDDPTIRRCIGFAKALGYSGLKVVNLFALRSTSPAALSEHPDPVGPRNDEFILRAASGGMLIAASGGMLIAAWGAHPFAAKRAREVADVLHDAGVKLQALKVTKEGHPGHPLYLPGDSRPAPWGPAGTAMAEQAVTDRVVSEIKADPVLSLAISLDSYLYSPAGNDAGAPAVAAWVRSQVNPPDDTSNLLLEALNVTRGQDPAYRGMDFWNMMANLEGEDVEKHCPDDIAVTVIEGIKAAHPEAREAARRHAKKHDDRVPFWAGATGQE